MLRIQKESNETTTLKIDISIDVEKELKEYIKVGKHFKLMDKTTNINDVVGVMLEKLLNDGEYQQLKVKWEKEMEVKKEKDRLRKRKEKEQKEVIKNQITVEEVIPQQKEKEVKQPQKVDNNKPTNKPTKAANTQKDVK